MVESFQNSSSYNWFLSLFVYVWLQATLIKKYWQSYSISSQILKEPVSTMNNICKKIIDILKKEINQIDVI